MQKIFIDFEMNCVPQREIIEVGAVKLDENNSIVSEYHSYVRPNFELNDRIALITGITKKDIETAPILENVLNEFLEWCGSEKYIIYSWSKSDLKQLIYETEFKKISNSVLSMAFSHWKDYQLEFGQMINYHGELSLKNATAAVGRSFKGRQHSAIDDARNTAYIYTFASCANNHILNTIRELFTPKQIAISIGELFPDLSSLICTSV